MNKPLGRRTVGGLLLTRGGAILVFRDDAAASTHSHTKSCTRRGCGSKHSSGDGDHSHALRRDHVKPSPRPRAGPQGRGSAVRDLLSHLKERVSSRNSRRSGGGGRAEGRREGGGEEEALVSAGLPRSVDEDQHGWLTSETGWPDGGNGGGGWDFEFEIGGSNDRLQPSRPRADDAAFFDRHREMRMDIDDMSYEELLALGERIGTVSTGLSEDALVKCLHITRFKSLIRCADNLEEFALKCSICQEEYVAGDELGHMACGHRYHRACVGRWLRQKNWCPICKTVAAPFTVEADPTALHLMKSL